MLFDVGRNMLVVGTILLLIQGQTTLKLLHLNNEFVNLHKSTSQKAQLYDLYYAYNCYGDILGDIRLAAILSIIALYKSSQN